MLNVRKYKNNTILSVKKTSFVRKGGRCFQFSTESMYNNKNYIGFGRGKSKNLHKSVNKSIYKAKKNCKKIVFYNKGIKNYFKGKYKTTLIEFFPVEKKFIAGGILRTVLKTIKIKNITCKSIGSKNICGKIEVLKKFFKFNNKLFLNV